LPSYLSVHMVRFAWKADIGKKAKIVRRVKFPLELDALDLTTDELKTKLLPASMKVMEVEKERGERRKVRKRTKAAGGSSSSSAAAGPAGRSGDVEMSDATIATAAATASNGEETTNKEDKGKGAVLGGDLEDEGIYRARQAAEFQALVDSSLKNDLGCSTTGLYELVAIVTHKGAAADSGHYIGFVKKSVFYAANAKAKELNADLNRKLNLLEGLVNTPLPDSATPTDPMLTSIANSLINDPGAVAPSLLANTIRVQGNSDSTDSNSAPVAGPSNISTADLESEDDENWYKFDDEKVTEFPKEKLSTLEGGGEDSSAYVLVYKSKVL